MYTSKIPYPTRMQNISRYRQWLYAFGALVLLGNYLVLQTLYDAGGFKKITPYFQGDSLVKIVTEPGSGDIEIDHESGLAFISCDDRRANNQRHETQGGIFVLDLNAPEARPEWVSETMQREFHPQGLSLYRAGDGTQYLFVVNHLYQEEQPSHSIEIFAWDGETLQHRETIRSEALIHPNSVIAVGPRQFYITNDHASNPRWMRRVEDFLRLPLASVYYYDGLSFSRAASGILHANGIGVSPNGKEIYVASSTGRRILIFDRKPLTGELSFKSRIYCNTGVDNIHVTPEGELWVAAHPKMLSFLAHAKDAAKPSPSQVLRITPQPGSAKYDIEEVFIDTGELLSGASTAVRYKDDLLIGAVYAPYILRGKLANERKRVGFQD